MSGVAHQMNETVRAERQRTDTSNSRVNSQRWLSEKEKISSKGEEAYWTTETSLDLNTAS